MKILKRESSKYLFRLVDEDFKAVEASQACYCGEEARYELLALGLSIKLCPRCRSRFKTLWLPSNHELSTQADLARANRLKVSNQTGRVKQVRLNELQKYELVRAAAEAQGSCSTMDIKALCLKFKYNDHRFWKRAKYPTGPVKQELVSAIRSGMGVEELEALVLNLEVVSFEPSVANLASLEQKLKLKPAPYQSLSKEEVYYYQLASSEVLAEGREVEEVVEEYELDEVVFKEVLNYERSVQNA